MVTALAVVAVASTATAGVTVITSLAGTSDSFAGGVFTLQGPKGAVGNTTGVYGVETRVGKLNGADWQVGVGPGTSQPGYFHQANETWGASDSWSLTWNASGISFQIDNNTPVTWGSTAALTDNTLKIYNNGGAVTVKDIGGVALAAPVTIVSGGSALFYSSTGFAGGLTADGTMSLPNQSGRIKGSSNEILFKEGTWTPSGVPEPAAWTFMILGVGAIGMMARRKRARLGLPAAAAHC